MLSLRALAFSLADVLQVIPPRYSKVLKSSGLCVFSFSGLVWEGGSADPVRALFDLSPASGDFGSGSLDSAHAAANASLSELVRDLELGLHSSGLSPVMLRLFLGTPCYGQGHSQLGTRIMKLSLGALGSCLGAPGLGSRARGPGVGARGCYLEGLGLSPDMFYDWRWKPCALDLVFGMLK
jgi:hypothetical protein